MSNKPHLHLMGDTPLTGEAQENWAKLMAYRVTHIAIGWEEELANGLEGLLNNNNLSDGQRSNISMLVEETRSRIDKIANIAVYLVEINGIVE